MAGSRYALKQPTPKALSCWWRILGLSKLGFEEDLQATFFGALIAIIINVMVVRIVIRTVATIVI